MRQGFRLAEVRAMSVDVAEAYLEILYPAPLHINPTILRPALPPNLSRFGGFA